MVIFKQKTKDRKRRKKGRNVCSLFLVVFALSGLGGPGMGVERETMDLSYRPGETASQEAPVAPGGPSWGAGGASCMVAQLDPWP